MAVLIFIVIYRNFQMRRRKANDKPDSLKLDSGPQCLVSNVLVTTEC